MEPLYDAIQHLPDYGGYFGYSVYKEYITYVDIDEWTGGSPERHWSHQAFYEEFMDQKEDGMAQGVIEFLKTNNLVKPLR